MYSKEIKRSAVEELFSGKTAKQVCEECGLSISSLRQWQVDQVVKLPAGKSDAQIMNILKNKLYSQQLELEIWNQCTCFKKLSLSEKYDDMLKLVPKYGVHAVCKVLDVPRGTYYNRLLRSPDKTQLEVKDEKLKPVIRSIFEETKGMIGSAKIRIIMMNRGYSIDLKHLRRLMSEMNLVCTTRQRSC